LDRKSVKLLEQMPNCWEYNNCAPDVRSACPAYPERGKECWKVTGLSSAMGRPCPSFSDKILYCRNECEFYRKYLKNVFR